MHWEKPQRSHIWHFKTIYSISTIPCSFGKLQLLECLYLQVDSLPCEIPLEMDNLSQVRFFFAEDNSLSGSVPSEMAQLTNIRNLILSDNSLTSGANELCSLTTNEGSLIFYYTDCYSQTVPTFQREIECTCCMVCCADSVGCLPNGIAC
jgi:hypothetical protein